MPRRAPRPSQGWGAFLAAHAEHIVAIDMLTVRTLALDTLYAFVVLGHGRRHKLHIEVAHRPTALWLACEIQGALGGASLQAPILVRDNDRLYGAVFRRRLRAMGVRDHPTQPRSPWQNGQVERLIGSIRRECLNQQIILNAAHLRRVLQDYADYYNFDRTHLALRKDLPLGRPVETNGRITSCRVGGGLHRRYTRVPPNEVFGRDRRCAAWSAVCTGATLGFRRDEGFRNGHTASLHQNEFSEEEGTN